MHAFLCVRTLLTSRTGAALRTEGARPSIKDPTALVIQTWAGQLLLRLTTLARGSLPPRPPPQEGCVSTAGQNNEWMDGGRDGGTIKRRIDGRFDQREKGLSDDGEAVS